MTLKINLLNQLVTVAYFDLSLSYYSKRFWSCDDSQMPPVLLGKTNMNDFEITVFSKEFLWMKFCGKWVHS